MIDIGIVAAAVAILGALGTFVWRQVQSAKETQLEILTGKSDIAVLKNDIEHLKYKNTDFERRLSNMEDTVQRIDKTTVEIKTLVSTLTERYARS